LIHEFGNEAAILADVPIRELARVQPERVSQGIERMRRGAVRILPGHDGYYGKITLFEKDLPEQDSGGQMALF
jgi:PHP family Zn ribbon phosphoesterase